MAKKGPSKHSRSARRAMSPGIDLDKSLKNMKPPEASVDTRPSVLGIRQAAGVSKRTKQGRKAVLSAKARKRQERGVDRSEAILERTLKKVERSKNHASVIQSRSKEWTEINARIVQETGIVGKAQKTSATMFGALAGGDGDDNASEEDEMDADSGDEAVRRFYGELDEDMDEAETAKAGAAPQQQPAVAVAPEFIALPADGDEDIL